METKNTQELLESIIDSHREIEPVSFPNELLIELMIKEIYYAVNEHEGFVNHNPYTNSGRYLLSIMKERGIIDKEYRLTETGNLVYKSLKNERNPIFMKYYDYEHAPEFPENN